MVEMRFDYRDLFRSTRVAFSLQRIWVQFIGLFFGYIGYAVFAYLSLFSTGKESIAEFWESYHLLPCVFGAEGMHWYSWVLFCIGVFILVFFWLVSATGVARAAYMHLKGNTFYTWKEAFNFALKSKSGSLIATPITILVIAVFTGLGGVFMGLLGRIPYVGELGISLFSVIWFVASLFLVFVLLALGVSLLLIPAILATTDDDAFEGIFQSFSILYSQPWRLIIYNALVGFFTVLGFAVFAFFAKVSWVVMSRILMLGMGEKYENLSFNATYLFKKALEPAVTWLQELLVPAVIWLYELFVPTIYSAKEIIEKVAFIGKINNLFELEKLPESVTLSGTEVVSSYILAFFMVIICGFVLSYALSIYNVGCTYIFLILKKKKDDENLLERKDREEEEEEFEEPVEGKKEPVKKEKKGKMEKKNTKKGDSPSSKK
jgi:hypothetical protein